MITTLKSELRTTRGSTASRGYLAPVETHTDGTLWIKCIGGEPKPGKLWNGLHVYHGDARITESGTYGYGSDDHYRCPHCGDSWWVEYDG
jgi:hypothetical protein